MCPSSFGGGPALVNFLVQKLRCSRGELLSGC